MLLALGQSTRGNGEQLGVRHLSDGDFTAIEHLDGFSVQLVGNFADSCQIAILGRFDQLGCNPAQGKRLAPELHEERAVRRLFTVRRADRPSHDVLHW